MEIVGLKELAEGLPAEESRALMSDVGARLRGQSIGGDTAARLDPEKYGILHATPFDQKAVTEQVRNLVRRRGPAATAAEAVGVRGATLDLHAKCMSDEDAASAMAFAVQRCANDGAEGFSLRSTEDRLKALLNTTVSRVRVLRSAVTGRNFQQIGRASCRERVGRVG